MTILVDMDDTIEQLLNAWLKLLNERYHQSVAYDDITEWDVSKAFPDLTRTQVYEVLGEEALWESVEPIPGAAEVLQSWLDCGHRVFVVTAASHESLHGLPAKFERVLFRYFPFLTWDNVIVAKTKQMIRGDVLIDDGVHNLEGGEYRKILVTAPNNREYDAEANGMIRADNWNDIRRIIEKWTEEERTCSE